MPFVEEAAEKDGKTDPERSRHVGPLGMTNIEVVFGTSEEAAEKVISRVSEKCRAFLAQRRGRTRPGKDQKGQGRDGGLKMDWTKPLPFGPNYGC